VRPHPRIPRAHHHKVDASRNLIVPPSCACLLRALRQPLVTVCRAQLPPQCAAVALQARGSPHGGSLPAGTLCRAPYDLRQGAHAAPPCDWLNAPVALRQTLLLFPTSLLCAARARCPLPASAARPRTNTLLESGGSGSPPPAPASCMPECRRPHPAHSQVLGASCASQGAGDRFGAPRVTAV
jgi:hypothetical protein